MWEQAQILLPWLYQIQQQTETPRTYLDLNQQELAKSGDRHQQQDDNEIQIEAGYAICKTSSMSRIPDGYKYACIDDMIKHTQECDPMSNSFEACMESDIRWFTA
ncbi:MAG: hypothetical protein H6668_16335 [Ardenticatenaceae bacterium]|nr:hypothetical protein [Ardenticatenaceae bacterium]